MSKKFICESCDGSVSDNASFCNHCGSEFVEIADATKRRTNLANPKLVSSIIDFFHKKFKEAGVTLTNSYYVEGEMYFELQYSSDEDQKVAAMFQDVSMWKEAEAIINRLSGVKDELGLYRAFGTHSTKKLSSSKIGWKLK